MTRPEPARRSRIWVAVGVLVALGAVALGFGLWTVRRGADVTVQGWGPTAVHLSTSPGPGSGERDAAARSRAQPDASDARPDASDARPDASVAQAAPRTIELRVEVTPSRATVTVDGEPCDNPCERTVARDSSPHVIEAEGAGYVPRSKSVRFERDVELVWELDLAPRRRERDAGVKRRPIKGLEPWLDDPAPRGGTGSGTARE